MLGFFRAGGFNMWVLAVLGIAILVFAAKFARNADAQRLSLIRALTWALVFSSINGFVAGLAVTAKHVIEWEPADPLPYLLGGFSESCANLLLGGGLLSITWTLVAVGVRRMPRDPE
jgi:hypothetical protein